MRRTGRAIHLRVAVITADGQVGAIIEVPDEAKVKFIDLMLHVGGVRPLNLAAEIASIQYAIAIPANGIVDGVGLDRRASAEINGMLEDDRRTHRYEGRRMAERVVTAGFRLGAMRIEDDRSALGEFPFRVEAERVQLVFRGAVGLLEADIFRAIIVFLHEHGRGDQAIIVEDDLVERCGKPVGLLVAQFVRLRLGVGVVTGEGEVVHRTELENQLTVQALTGNVGEVVTAILRDGVELAGSWRVGDLGRAVTACVAAIDCAVCGFADDPVIDLLGWRAGVTLGVGPEDADAEAVGWIGPACEAGQFRREVVAGFHARVVDGLGREGRIEARIVKGRARLDVDRGTDTARWQNSLAGLVDFQTVDAFRGEVREVERAVAASTIIAAGTDGANLGGRHRAAVQRDQVEARSETANSDLGAFAVDPVDGHTRDALKRFSEVGVRELTDIFG